MRRSIIVFMSGLFVILGGAGSLAGAEPLVVRPNGGRSFRTLQAAIDAAAPGDTVLALPGTYSGPGNRDLDYQGKDIAVIGQGGSTMTTIDCEYQGRGAVFLSGESRAALLAGFHIVHGGGLGRFTGGGVHCENSSPTLSDLWIDSSDVSNVGGVEALFGAPLLSNLLVVDNAVNFAGGGFGFYWTEDAEVVDCLFAGTSVGGYGGGGEVYEGSAAFHGTHFIGNHAGISGGGLFCTRSTAVLIDCYFEGNDADDGGAIAIRGTNLTVQGSVLVGNWVSRWGGAIYFDELGDPSTGLIENSDFRGNRANAGSAILVHEQGSPVLRGLSLVGNYGTAIDCLWGTVVSIENCLVAENHLAYGISVVDTDQVTVTCCNVWGNEGGDYGGLLVDQTGINGNISEDPLLCDATFDSLGLADGSPCLPENNDCGVLMGNHGAECTLTAAGEAPPAGIGLGANYPNPFNPSTSIPFSLESPAVVTLSVLDVRGRLVRTLATRSFPAGRHVLQWDGLDAAGRPAPSGVYLYRLETSAGATARPMLMLK